jgi:glutathione S-transferase
MMTTTHISPVTLYQHPKSGHCHKVVLFMHLIDVPYHAVTPDLSKGEHKSDAFIAMNPFGQIPVLVDGKNVVSDSNAILTYLANTYTEDPAQWLGKTSIEKAEIQRWFSISAGELAKGPAAARLQFVFGATIDEAKVLDTSVRLLSTLERHLSQQDECYLVSNRLTAADIAMFSYIAHAPEGGLSLEEYPNINMWINNIESLASFVAMPSSPIPQARA